MFGHHGCGILEPGAPGPMGKGRHLLQHLAGVNLTDEQILKLAEMGGDAFIGMGHARLHMMEAFHKLIHEVSQPEIDREKVNAIAEEIKQKRAAQTDRMVGKLLAFAEVLTPEQRQHVRVNRIRHFFGMHSAENPAG